MDALVAQRCHCQFSSRECGRFHGRIAQRLHAALDATAGRVLFADAVDGFVADHPHYAPLRGELLRFFELSRGAFFSGTAEPVATEMRWLLDVARSLRDAERGSA